MDRIVRENDPVADLPEDLRAEFAGTERVRVVIEPIERHERVLSLEELWALRQPPFKTAEQIAEEVRRDRDEWDD